MYQALYRKWRPKTFDDVVGQSHITDALKNQVANDRLSHAYLFIGTRGTGKTTCAKILAKAVNCEHPVNGNPCNVCPTCLGIDDGSIMDVVEMDAASNNGVDNVRQLRDEAVFSPAAAKKRVYIVDEVHMLSTAAFNALLKILEEPPAHLMFILATTELNKVPATILSRCQRHSFKRLDTQSIIGRLEYVARQEGLPLTPEAAAILAGLAEGGMRDALSMLDQCSGREKIDADTVYSALGLAGNRQVAQLLDCIARHDTPGAIGLFGQLWQGGKDPATLLGELSALQRDLLLLAVAPKGGNELLSGSFDAATLEQFRDAFSTGALVNNINIIQAALGEMRSGQARTVCELTLITLCEPDLGDSLPMLRERVAALERLCKNGAPAAPAAPAAPVSQPTPAPAPRSEPEPEPEPPSEWAPPPPSDEDAPPLAPDTPAPEPTPAPVPEPAPEPTPAPAPAPAGDDELWAQLCRRLPDAFSPGIAAVLTDPQQVTGVYADGLLTLQLRAGFAAAKINTPDVLAKLAAIAGETAGRPVRVRAGDLADPPPSGDAGSKLDALGKFDIVKFK